MEIFSRRSKHEKTWCGWGSSFVPLITYTVNIDAVSTGLKWTSPYWIYIPSS